MRNVYRKVLTAATQPVDRAARQLLPHWVTVFMLHRIAIPERGISGISQRHLSDCLAYLRQNGYAFISLRDAVNLALADRLEKRKWVAFSMDDGYFEQVDVASEIFARFDCPATGFLITDYIDGKLWPWDHKLIYIVGKAKITRLDVPIDGRTYELDLRRPDVHRAVLALIRKKAAPNAYSIVAEIAELAGVELPQQPPEDFRSTSWDRVRAMEARGMQFGAHSASHRILSKLDDADLEREIAQSVQRVRSECTQPSNLFCYPSGKAGEFDQRAVECLKGLGVTAAFAAEPGFLSAKKLREDERHRFALPRMTVPNNFDEFKLYVSWAQYLRESLSAGRMPLESASHSAAGAISALAGL